MVLLPAIQDACCSEFTPKFHDANPLSLLRRRATPKKCRAFLPRSLFHSYIKVHACALPHLSPWFGLVLWFSLQSGAWQKPPRCHSRPPHLRPPRRWQAPSQVAMLLAAGANVQASFLAAVFLSGLSFQIVLYMYGRGSFRVYFAFVLSRISHVWF